MGQNASKEENMLTGIASGLLVSGVAIACTGGVAAGPIGAYLLGAWTSTQATGIVLSAAAAGGFLFCVEGSKHGASHAPDRQVNEEIWKLRKRFKQMQEDVKHDRKQRNRLEQELEEALKTRASIAKDWPLPDGFNEEHVNIALVGNSGVGKSSFLNKILNEKKVKTGVKETTMKMEAFDADLLGLRLKVWDVPGAGTNNFPADKYIKDMGLRYFDALVILTGDRWTESDVKLFEASRRFRIPCYIVRTKMDVAIESNEEDNDTTPADTMAEVCDHLKSNIGRANWDRIFLITVRNKYTELLKPEFDRLIQMVAIDLQKSRDIKVNIQDGESVSGESYATDASASSDASSSSSWLFLGGCFTKGTMLPVPPDGSLKEVSSFEEGDEVASVRGETLTVASAIKHPRGRRDLVHIHTAVSDLVVTADHRIEIEGELVKQANMVSVGDIILCGARPRPVTKVSKFRMNAEIIELSFNPDWPVETFKGSSIGISTYGEPFSSGVDDLRSDDGY